MILGILQVVIRDNVNDETINLLILLVAQKIAKAIKTNGVKTQRWNS